MYHIWEIPDEEKNRNVSTKSFKGCISRYLSEIPKEVLEETWHHISNYFLRPKYQIMQHV